MENASLPQGVTINPDCHATSLDDCNAICVTTVDADGREGELICWRNRKSILTLVDVKRIRDLRPGCKVLVGEKRRTVTAVQIYR